MTPFAPPHPSRSIAIAALAMSCIGCAGFLPSHGPTASRVSSGVDDSRGFVQLVGLDASIVDRLAVNRRSQAFSEILQGGSTRQDAVGNGDRIAISLWEAPPATLFGGATPIPGLAPSTSQGLDLPDQVVSSDGTVQIPFIGRLVVAGLTPRQIEDEIARSLKGKANQAQALVRVTGNATANVTVVGAVAASQRMPLTPKRERLLDALAAAGSTPHPSSKLSVQVTRGKTVATMPLDRIIRDPAQDIELQPGDVVSVLYQPFSFTAMGAAGRNEEIDFEAAGISLSQALARIGGLNDARANPRGVFVFRFESETALDWATPPAITRDRRVPVIYRVDLTDPVSFFVAQGFTMNDGDVLYVANAPSVELEKFLAIIQPLTAPLVTGVILRSVK